MKETIVSNQISYDLLQNLINIRVIHVDLQFNYTLIQRLIEFSFTKRVKTMRAAPKIAELSF